MVTTSTPTSNQNYLNHSENLGGEISNELDLMFYESIKPQMDQLKKNPEDETIARILAYSRSL